MTRNRLSAAAGLLLPAPMVGVAAENLRVNPHLDYSSDSQDGPPITGERMDEGAAAGKPNYIIFYGEG